MNALDEADVREQLRQALEVLDPVAPPLGQIQARASKRHRRVRIAGGLGAVAVAAACAVMAVVVLPGGQKATIVQPAAPSHRSLVHFAAAHGVVKHGVIGGPFERADGFYGGFAVKDGVDVASWHAGAWHLDGPTLTQYHPGSFVMKIAAGPTINGPSIYVREMGGDVSYFGSVLEHSAAGWRSVRFGSVATELAYLHPGGPGMVSIRNTCRPNCAAGTHYRETWRWNSSTDRFVHVRSRRLST